MSEQAVIRAANALAARLEADNAKLRAALEPFAKMADQVEEWQKGTGQFTGAFDAKDLFRARELLATFQ